jgi:hypothetical protein
MPHAKNQTSDLVRAERLIQSSPSLVRFDDKLRQELVRQRVEVVAVKLGFLACAKIALCILR